MHSILARAEKRLERIYGPSPRGKQSLRFLDMPSHSVDSHGESHVS